MELYQIRHFVAVAETGSFTKAGIRTAVSQPALSVSIAKLEEELGVRLFHRSPKSISLTPAGRRFQTTAQEVLSACNKVKAELRASPRISRGSLKSRKVSCRKRESSLSMEREKSCMPNSPPESCSHVSL